MTHIRFIVRHARSLIIVMMLVLSACGGNETPTPTLEPPPTDTPVPTPTVVPSPTPIPNTPPQIVTLAGNPREICPGAKTGLVAVVVDADGDPLTYVWNSETGTISNETQDSNGGKADYQGSTSPGEDTIELTVSDGRGGTQKSQTSIKVRGDCIPEVGINSPDKILTCPADDCQFEVKGFTSSVISRSDFNDLRLYVLVYPINPAGAGWYIQLQPGAIQSSDGLWSQSPSWLGGAKAGNTFKIVAVIVSTDVKAKTISGTMRSIDQMTGSNNDNVVKDPKDLNNDTTVFILSDEVNLTVQR